MVEVSEAIPVVQMRDIESARWRGLAPYLGFGLFSLLISLAFYWDGVHADYSALNGDQFNIIPVCAKKDNPRLFRGDQIVGNLQGVDYYTPAFVDLVRLLALPDHNYLKGLNRLVLLTTLVYLWGWWLLFSLWGDKWLAALGAFFVRGLLWPPGNELWGISGIWSMVPRTPYLALLPWVLWGWFRNRQTRYGWFAACLACGLIANMHPISGLAVGVALVMAEFAWTLAETRKLRGTTIRCLLGGTLLLLGLAPFIWTYLSKLGGVEGLDSAALEQALRMRLKPVFFYPTIYLRAWLTRPSLLLLVFVPWLCCLLIPRRHLKEYKHVLLALGAFSVGCLLTSLLPFAVEDALRRLGYHPRFAFQLVRTAKYVLVPSIILAYLLVALASRQLMRRFEHGRAIMIGLSCAAILLTLFARQPIFNRVPLLGDDFCRFLWPEWMMTTPPPEFGDKQMDSLLKWIRENTPVDAKFVGPRPIRIGALRSVIHDWAGAVILIEGDPKGYLAAARREQQLRSPEYRDPMEKAKLMASWGGDYWVTSYAVPTLRLAYTSDGWFVYDLRGIRDTQAASIGDGR